MFSRKYQDQEDLTPPSYSELWEREVTNLLSNLYKSECQQGQKIFDVYSFLYEDELVIIVSLLSEQDSSIIPVTCFFSVDIPDKGNFPFAKYLNAIVDYTSAIFNSTFEEGEVDYFNTWTKIEMNDLEFYYRIGRENVSLTLQANKLLSSKE